MGSLEDLLNESAPDLGPTSKPMAAFDDLVATTRTAAVVLVGGGAAAAVTGSYFDDWLAPWAAEPTGTLSFTLPAGGVCEQRIGDLTVANPEAEKMIHAWLAEHTLAEIADIGAATEGIRAEGPQTYFFGGDTGARPDVRFGYGTANYDADYEYADAVYRVEGEAVTAKLLDEGYTAHEDYAYSWSSELQCTGSNPYPSIPEFAK